VAEIYIEREKNMKEKRNRRSEREMKRTQKEGNTKKYIERNTRDVKEKKCWKRWSKDATCLLLRFIERERNFTIAEYF
jgi:hypothetical protein